MGFGRGKRSRTMTTLLAIDGRIIVGRDKNGTILHDGDSILSFNLMADGEKYPLAGPKRGVPCKIRRGQGCTLFVVTNDGGMTGLPDGHMESERYGVEKL
jgi:hypothetical protein